MTNDLAPYRTVPAHPLGRLVRVHRMDRWAAAKVPLAYGMGFALGGALRQLFTRGRSGIVVLLYQVPIWLGFSALMYFWRVRGVRRVAVHEKGIELGEEGSARRISYSAMRSVETHSSWIDLVLTSGERVYVSWSEHSKSLLDSVRERIPALP